MSKEEAIARRRQQILTYLSNKSSSTSPARHPTQIADRLGWGDIGIVVNAKTISRDLHTLYDENTNSGDKKYGGLYNRKEGRQILWGWDDAFPLHFDIPMDARTALIFKIMQNRLQNMFHNWQFFNLEPYFLQAEQTLIGEGDDNTNEWAAKKIRVLDLPDEDFIPSQDDEDAAFQIYNALITNHSFTARYSKSAFDLDGGKWKPKNTLDHRGILDRHHIRPLTYYPLGMVFKGPICFLIAKTNVPGRQNPAWLSTPGHFALHKFSKVKVLGKAPIDNLFKMEKYLGSRVMDTPVDPVNKPAPQRIDLTICVSEAVAEYLYESGVYGLTMIANREDELLGGRGCQREGWRIFEGEETRDTGQLRRFLLSLKEVEIISPTWLRDEFKHIAETTLNYYDD